MDEILHDYTAGELLEWLNKRTIDEYLDSAIEEVDGESYPISILNIERIKTDFIREIRRYEVVKRGYTLYIFDNKTCHDIFSYAFTDENYEEMQNTVNETCDALNSGKMRFVSKKEKCW